MTLTMAWVRHAGRHDELVVASDSRVRAGYAWDAAPKIMPLPRGDAVIAFAGVTDHAYPIMLQLANAVSAYEHSTAGRLPIEDLRGHLVKVMNSMFDEMHDPSSEGLPLPEATFLLAGFSWVSGRFKIWTFYYDAKLSAYTFKPGGYWKGAGPSEQGIVMVGNHVTEAKQRLASLLQAFKTPITAANLDMEPLRMLSGLIDDDMNFPSIGGPIQLVKVYRYMKTVPFVVQEHRFKSPPVAGTATTISHRRSLLGRPLLDYEAVRYPTIRINLFGEHVPLHDKPGFSGTVGVEVLDLDPPAEGDPDEEDDVFPSETSNTPE